MCLSYVIIIENTIVIKNLKQRRSILYNRAIIWARVNKNKSILFYPVVLFVKINTYKLINLQVLTERPDTNIGQWRIPAHNREDGQWRVPERTYSCYWTTLAHAGMIIDHYRLYHYRKLFDGNDSFGPTPLIVGRR